MKKLSLLCIIWLTILSADDYDFNFDEIEVTPYEYSGYIKGEMKNLKTVKDTTFNSYLGEVQLKFKYTKDAFSLNSEFKGDYAYVDDSDDTKLTVNQLFVNYKADHNNNVAIGKKSLKWGKGYFFNPVAFLDRKKNPDDPEASKEGFIMANYKYNKSYVGDLKNFSLDVIYLPTSDDINEDYSTDETSNIALKAYFLYLDTDIDFIYLFSNKDKDKVGVDFSKNIQTNFEIHGEFAYEIDGYHSYLLGLKYLTSSELTITSEYMYQSEKLSIKVPFYDKQYLVNRFSQKEPIDILYLSIYYKNMLNLEDYSYKNTFGILYNFRNNLNLDVSYNKNDGKHDSEFGRKFVSDNFWTKVVYYF